MPQLAARIGTKTTDLFQKTLHQVPVSNLIHEKHYWELLQTPFVLLPGAADLFAGPPSPFASCGHGFGTCQSRPFGWSRLSCCSQDRWTTVKNCHWSICRWSWARSSCEALWFSRCVVAIWFWAGKQKLYLCKKYNIDHSHPTWLNTHLWGGFFFFIFLLYSPPPL